MIFIILAFGYSYYSLKDFISPKKQDSEQLEDVKEVKEIENKEEIKPNNTAVNKANESVNNDDFGGFGDIYRSMKSKDELVRNNKELLSKNWRITGELVKDGRLFVVLIDRKNNLRLEPRSLFENEGRSLKGVIGGEVVSYYSGVDGYGYDVIK